MSSRTKEAYLAAIDEGWANPHRLHSESRAARALLDGAREEIAAILGASAEHTFFTPGPELAMERAVSGLAAARREPFTAVASAIENQTLVRHLRSHAKERVSFVPVEETGRVDPQAFASAVRTPGVTAVALQHGNREIGTLQDIDTAADICAETGSSLIVDATASLGHVAPPTRWNVLLGHPADWGGPTGLGILALSPTTRWLSDLPGGKAAPSNSANVPAALAAAVALQERTEQRTANQERLAALKGRIATAATEIPNTRVYGDDPSLPHVLSFSCMYVDGESLVAELDRAGFAVSSGSACANDVGAHSHVIEAVGGITHGNVRIGLPPTTSHEDIDRFLAVLPEIVADTRAKLGAPE